MTVSSFGAEEHRCIVVGIAEDKVKERLTRAFHDDRVSFVAPGDIDRVRWDAIEL